MVSLSLLAVFALSSPTTNDQGFHYSPGYLTNLLTNGWLDDACCDDAEPATLTARLRSDRAEHSEELVGPNQPVLVAAVHGDQQHQPYSRPADLPFDPLSEPSFSAPPSQSLVAMALASAEVAAPKLARSQPAEPLLEAPAAAAPLQLPTLEADALVQASGPGVFQEFIESQPQLQPAQGLREINHRIRVGETISHVLDSAGVSPAEVSTWLSAANRVYNLNHVYAGQEVSFLVDSGSQSLEHLSLEIDRKSLLIANRKDGQIVAERREVPNFRRIRVASGEIATSLYMAALTSGIPDAVISAMAEILGWDIDFSRDVRPGATFRVAYEEIVRLDTNESIPGRVLAVELTNRNRKLEGIYFTPSNGGRGGYFDRNGHALGRAFLRYPVEFSRISSQFSTARLHPIKKIPLPHYGVDFAAPTGTPVVASADGEVLIAGWAGGNGRLIKIRHDDTYQSAYAHLSRIAPEVVKGARVRKGQVIGNVGSTGLATGPHLHYAMYRFGKYIDPLSAELPRERSLSAGPLKAFEIVLGLIDATYARAGDSDGPQLAAALPQ